jgi:hypothetical protein
MEYQNLYQDGAPPPPLPAGPKPTGRTRRILMSAGAATVLLGSGAAIGVAMTGGASAAPSAATVAAAHCHRGAIRMLAGRHPLAARRLAATCHRFGPLRRLLAAGAIHGEVTFQREQGMKTVGFERGTVLSASASAVTVRASDGTTWTWDIVARTALREGGHPVSSVATGEHVLVAGPVVTGVRDARLIWIKQGG